MTPEPISMWAVVNEQGAILQFTLRKKRADAISEWKRLFAKNVANKKWERFRRKGKARAVRVTVSVEQDQ